MKAQSLAQAFLAVLFAISTQANEADRKKAPDVRPINAPPLVAKTEGDIHFAYGTRSKDGKFTPAHPTKKRFSHDNKDYLVAIDNSYDFAGSEPYPQAWFYIYDKAAKAWTCFQETHFRNVVKLDAELDKAKGVIVIRAVGNEKQNGKILTTFNLLATSDNASFAR